MHPHDPGEPHVRRTLPESRRDNQVMRGPLGLRCLLLIAIMCATCCAGQVGEVSWVTCPFICRPPCEFEVPIVRPFAPFRVLEISREPSDRPTVPGMKSVEAVGDCKIDVIDHMQFLNETKM
jgi:hypothetical protein